MGLNIQITENAHLGEQGGVVITLQTFIGNVHVSNLGWDTGCAELYRYRNPARQLSVHRIGHDKFLQLPLYCVTNQ